jgi:LL-diaminopimelate aminotransferase
MIRINDNYSKLKASYLFADIAKRVNAYVAAHPGKPVIRLGIGDVTEPLPPVCIAALHAATDEMANRATFKGYGPEQGYAFLREAIAQHDFRPAAAHVEPDEVFVSDGSKCDVANIQEIFAADTKLAIPDPVYPVYVDTNVMAGRTGANVDGRYTGITYLDSTAANGYVPPAVHRRRPHLPLFPQQPDRRRRHQGPAHRVGRLREAAQRHHPLRRRLRGLHPHARHPALHLRDRGRARRRHRDAQLLQARRLHRPALRLHRRPEDPQGPRRRRQRAAVHALWNRRHTTKFNGVSYPCRRPPPRSTRPKARSRRAT